MRIAIIIGIAIVTGWAAGRLIERWYVHRED
nr:MAG TPA: Putative transmembrane protein [Caudoviricetes sp.]